LRIFTAFRPNRVYREEHVDRLAKQVKEYSGLDLDVVDDSPYKGWWCKMSLYREVGPVLFFDLDTVIVGDLEPMMRACEEHEFIMLEKFQRPYIQKRIGTSGVLGWKGDVKWILDRFEVNPESVMSRLQGDDQFLYDEVVSFTTYWQHLNPDWIRSYKIHMRKVNTPLPKECSVVCFHGVPKQWDINPNTGKSYEDEVRSRVYEFSSSK